MIDAEGEVVNGDQLLYALAAHAKRKGKLKGGVVGTLMTGGGLILGLEKLGIDFYRACVGDRFVMTALREKRWQIGGEPSGHIMHLGKMHSSDAIIAALLVLSIMHEREVSLSDLRKENDCLPQVIVNIPRVHSQVMTQNKVVQAAIHSQIAILGKGGRVVLRPSGTEPVMRLLVEGQEQAIVVSVADELSELVSEHC